MKAKWIAKWWDDKADRECVRGFETYEDAVTFQHKIRLRFNRRCEITLRAAK